MLTILSLRETTEVVCCCSSEFRGVFFQPASHGQPSEKLTYKEVRFSGGWLKCQRHSSRIWRELALPLENTPSPQDECEFERTSTFRITQHSIGNAFPIAACLISELWIFKKPNGRLLIFLRSGWETAGIDDPQWFSRIHCRWWTYSKEKKMNSQIFDWFCGALPYLWPNKAPLNCYLFTKEEKHDQPNSSQTSPSLPPKK